MYCACSLSKTALSIVVFIPVSLTDSVDRSHGWYQHCGMTTVAKAPAGGEINREGALMVAAVNGTIRPQSLSALDGIDKVAGRHEVNDSSRLVRRRVMVICPPPRRLREDACRLSILTRYAALRDGAKGLAARRSYFVRHTV